MREGLRRDATAIVFDLDTHATIEARDPHVDVNLVIPGFDSVAQEIEDHLLQLHGIPPDTG